MANFMAMRRHAGLFFVMVLTIAALDPDVAFSREPASPTHVKNLSVANHVAEASQRFGIPERWIHAVMHAESRGRVSVTSPAGAMGLMQIMPATWATLRARYELGNDPYDPRGNILAGTAYLREMYDQFGAAGFLAAYNAGPGRYLDYIRKGRVLPLETRAYVAKIMPIISNGPSGRLATNMPPVAHPAANSVAVHWTQSGLFASQIQHRNSVPSASLFAPAAIDQATTSKPEELLNGGLFVNISPSSTR